MSLNETPRSSRVHIALFGRRNSGKSSIINAITNQEIAIVSEVKGTTTDPVYKSMEILPIGPCVLIDTAGIDDLGTLGELRIKKTMEVLDKTDIALLIIDSSTGITEDDRCTLNRIKTKGLPAILVINKMDISKVSNEELLSLRKEFNVPVTAISALEKKGIEKLKQEIINLIPEDDDKFKIVGDLVGHGDLVVLVTPIDKAAPKGRLILPQQQVLRDLLDNGAIAIVTKENEFRQALEKISVKPRMVITDSQVFSKVAEETPRDVMLTSFSILFARYKGELDELIKGARSIKKLKDGDLVLISEGCTHHRQEDDIGKVKIPKWINQITGKKLEFEYSSGVNFTDDVKRYSLIVHCGGCMLNRAAMVNRINSAKNFNVPIINYGVLIAYVQGILGRTLEPFPLAKNIWEEEGK
jgi:[FeFe] hydrogenase H-cluster maturation GTPase HydF